VVAGISAGAVSLRLFELWAGAVDDGSGGDIDPVVSGTLAWQLLAIQLSRRNEITNAFRGRLFINVCHRM
jgi:hypothetical protein